MANNGSSVSAYAINVTTGAVTEIELNGAPAATVLVRGPIDLIGREIECHAETF